MIGFGTVIVLIIIGGIIGVPFVLVKQEKNVAFLLLATVAFGFIPLMFYGSQQAEDIGLQVASFNIGIISTGIMFSPGD